MQDWSVSSCESRWWQNQKRTEVPIVDEIRSQPSGDRSKGCRWQHVVVTDLCHITGIKLDSPVLVNGHGFCWATVHFYWCGHPFKIDSSRIPLERHCRATTDWLDGLSVSGVITILGAQCDNEREADLNLKRSTIERAQEFWLYGIWALFVFGFRDYDWRPRNWNSFNFYKALLRCNSLSPIHALIRFRPNSNADANLSCWLQMWYLVPKFCTLTTSKSLAWIVPPISW